MNANVFPSDKSVTIQSFIRGEENKSGSSHLIDCTAKTADRSKVAKMSFSFGQGPRQDCVVPPIDGLFGTVITLQIAFFYKLLSPR